MNRRNFLNWLGSFTALLVAPIEVCGHLQNPVQSQLAVLFQQPASAILVGQVYVDSLAGGADLEKLKRNWLSSPLIKQISTMNDVAFVKREIAESVRRDFSEGRSVNVKGWVLSETEAFLCALVYFDSLNP